MPETPPRSLPERLTSFFTPGFVARLALAFGLTALLLAVSRPVLGAGVARIARDLILLTSWVPYLDELAYHGQGFRVTTHLLAGHLTIDARAYWFVIAFPLGFAVALPGLFSQRGVRRVLGALLVSLAVAGGLLAIAADGLLHEQFRDLALRVSPPWRELLVRSAIGRFWDISALMYPFVACLVLAWGSSADAPDPDAPPLLHWTTAGFALAALLALLAADRAAEEKRVTAGIHLRPALEALNPDVGHHLLARARRLENRGRLAEAREAYLQAADYESQRQAAGRGLARIDARLGRAGGSP